MCCFQSGISKAASSSGTNRFVLVSLSEQFLVGMTAFCDLFVGLRNRRKRRATDVTCESLLGVEPGNSVTFKKKSWRKKKPSKLSEALSRLRDAYVDLMVKAAYKGDMSTLVYGNAYCGTEYRFDNSLSAFEKKAYISGIVNRSPNS